MLWHLLSAFEGSIESRLSNGLWFKHDTQTVGGIMDKREIFLAGSTFWGGQAFLNNLPGVIETELGITDSGAGTVTETFWLAYPDDEYLGTSECIKVVYDADVIPLPLLLKAFFQTIDPLSTKKQINYSGGMPEAKIFFTDPADETVASEAVAELQQGFDHPVTVEVVPLEGFSEAGEYAQDYINRNLGEDMIIDPAEADEFVAKHEDEFGRI